MPDDTDPKTLLTDALTARMGPRYMSRKIWTLGALAYALASELDAMAASAFPRHERPPKLAMPRDMWQTLSPEERQRYIRFLVPILVRVVQPMHDDHDDAATRPRR